MLVLLLNGSKWLFYQFFWRISGPISLFLGFIFLTFYLNKQGLKWRDLGLKWTNGYKTVLWFIIGLMLSVFVIMIANEVSSFFFEKPPRTNERFGDLSGNIQLTISWIVTGILIGGFGEELVYRGFLINALERIIDKRYGTVLAIILPASFWALRHYYYAHGYGSIMVFIVGIYFGVLYVANGRNLFPGIILHSLFDTVSFMARYEGN
ncbi:CPBP family intramembrane glutamic endopeptidase [Fulvivirga lutimaris]|uniref:CPBP family intramembrane glutamic endopeptidase n=1 Tax=Fulvivirga lutimaris TaxID=1819566 RepID=UPI001625B4EE|nr:type II CAAX endopeptidase family protein [Fulvivirga lutimaris]